MKNCKDGIIIGKTTNGFEIRVHGVKHDVNGNWVYLLSYFPKNRKISIQHGACCNRRLPIGDLREFVIGEYRSESAMEVAVDIVSYVNTYES